MTAETTPSTPHGRTPESDTVENAAATPETVQPYAELGLKDDEYATIRELLGRLGDKALAERVSVDAVPISRPDAALADPHAPNEE